MSLVNLDLKTLYKEMKLYEKLIEYTKARTDCTVEENNHAIAYSEKQIVKYKKAIREKLKKDDIKDRVMVKGDWDGYLVKIYCPDWVETMEDAEEWFDDYERIEMIYYPWDCTGQLFTCWYRIFNVNGKWICYHDVALDV